MAKTETSPTVETRSELEIAKDMIKSLRPLKAQLTLSQKRVEGLRQELVQANDKVNTLSKRNQSVADQLKNALSQHESCLNSLGNTADNLEAVSKELSSWKRRASNYSSGLNRFIAKGWFYRVFTSGSAIKKLIENG